MDPIPILSEDVTPRARELMTQHQNQIYSQTSRLFAVLMSLQWIVGILAAAWISPRTGAGAPSQIHTHVWLATLLGGAITSLPVFLALKLPCHAVTRHVVAASQMLMWAVLIQLTGGHIES